MTEPPTKKQRRRLNFDKCQFCRNAKKACTPADRTWPQRCNRCIDLGLDCAENSRLQGAPPLIPRQSDRRTIETSDTQRLNDLSFRVTWLRRLKFYHRVAVATFDKHDEFPWRDIMLRKLNQITGFITDQKSSLLTDIFNQSTVPHIQSVALVALLLDTEPASFQHPPEYPPPQLFPNALPESFAGGCDLGMVLAMTETLLLYRHRGWNKAMSNVELQQYCDTYLKVTRQLEEIIGPSVPALPPLHYILFLTRGEVTFRLTSSQTHFLAMQDYLGRSLLHLALDLGIMEDVMRFIEFDVATPIQDIGGRYPIIIACSGKSEAVVEYFLRNRANLSIIDADFRRDNGGLLLSAAASGGHTAVIELLLKKGASIDLGNKYSNTPLYVAAENGHMTVVKLLLKKGASINLGNKYSNTPLYVAAENGHTTVVKLLLKKSASINLGDQYGGTPLYVAAKNGHTAVVKLLLKKGAGINLGNKYGGTPLYVAARNGHTAVVKLLLKKGASINLGDEYGGTPLYAAAGAGHAAVIKLLLHKGAGIDLRDKYGGTPLYVAARNGHAAIIKLLLKKGASIDLGHKYNDTPLYIAARNGHATVAKLLLQHGAEPNTMDCQGKTPWEVVIERNHTEIVELLSFAMSGRTATLHTTHTDSSDLPVTAHPSSSPASLLSSSDSETDSDSDSESDLLSSSDDD